jgi:hypothetical protein
VETLPTGKKRKAKSKEKKEEKCQNQFESQSQYSMAEKDAITVLFYTFTHFLLTEKKDQTLSLFPANY